MQCAAAERAAKGGELWIHLVHTVYVHRAPSERLKRQPRDSPEWGLRKFRVWMWLAGQKEETHVQTPQRRNLKALDLGRQTFTCIS